MKFVKKVFWFHLDAWDYKHSRSFVECGDYRDGNCCCGNKYPTRKFEGWVQDNGGLFSVAAENIIGRKNVSRLMITGDADSELERADPKWPVMVVVGNAFSVSMLPRPDVIGEYLVGGTQVRFEPINGDVAREIVRAASGNILSVVGHADTAGVFSDTLEAEIPINRVSWKWEEDEILLVGQYEGPRLPEGATKLPIGAKIRWWLVGKDGRRK